MPIQTMPAVDLSGADLRRVEAYAAQNHLTLEEACTQLAQQSLQAKFARPVRKPALVLPFKART